MSKLRLRQSWTGALVLQVSNPVWSDWHDKYVPSWRDATVQDILNGDLANETLPINNPPNNP